MLGACTRYDGRCQPCQNVIALGGRHELIPVCPEQLGGLPIPRLPAEIRQGRVYDKTGADVSEAFERGADITLAISRMLACNAAILKSGSPSCGCGWVYDGTFSGRFVPGDGILTQRLKQAGIPVFSETDEQIGIL